MEQDWLHRCGADMGFKICNEKEIYVYVGL
jgi:hypothetical protein